MYDSDPQLTSLKIKILLARRKLNRAWAKSERTDATVLAAGEEFDALVNEYSRLLKKLLK